MKKLLFFLIALNIIILFPRVPRTDSYQTLFDLKDTEDNVRKINDTFYSISTGKQDKAFDIWISTPTTSDMQDGNIVTFYSDDTGRLIYRVNGIVYYVQGTKLP